ncbi:MAG TPA: peptide chain release factor N(5)-glutamine methyltransferase [Anaerolineaceae bacterium]|nr:peptide chain release factor N(5)-glutamine methyltransferase [Anaerolineaceae bacterium]HPN52776.1 peptide chain release factor N(5)-glutamine methyltransferase [Anaerolineaceae bacterium]
MTTNNSASLLADLTRRLAPLTGTPSLEAQVLLAHVLDCSRTRLLAHPETELSAAQSAHLNALAARRLAGEPLPYLIGRWEFYGNTFTVTPAVLIPRPETELLVETALAWLQAHPGRRRAADVGSGSGCIAITLALHCADLRLAAVDRSAAALAVAQQNACQHGVAQRVAFFQGDLLAAAAGPLDLVCANLPYIPSQTVDGLPVTRFEPRLALDGGADGLDLIRRLLAQLASRLAPGGLALFEIEAGQGQSALAAARMALPQAAACVLPDLAGLSRLLKIEFPTGRSFTPGRMFSPIQKQR